MKNTWMDNWRRSSFLLFDDKFGTLENLGCLFIFRGILGQNVSLRT